VGTKAAPPFAMKAEDGTWRGVSIDLWRCIANQIHLRYRFQETTLKGLTDGVAEGSFDASVAALTVTDARHRMVDFTQPFYSTGLAIAAASDAGISWWPIRLVSAALDQTARLAGQIPRHCRKVRRIFNKNRNFC
jgi:polar amino acid transport system substrate-binding protein